MTSTLFGFLKHVLFWTNHMIPTHFKRFVFFATRFPAMPLTDLQREQWRFMFDIVLMSILVILLLLAFSLLLLKRKNVPISQAIEVDPREPHSITITFVPASASIIPEAETTRPSENQSGDARTTGSDNPQSASLA